MDKRIADRKVVATHVIGVMGGRRPDQEIAAYAGAHSLVLPAKDDDFLTQRPPRQSRLVWLRCRDIGNRGVFAWLELRWASIAAWLQEGELIVEAR